MKFNKWTLGLAAVGAVSLVSVAKAEEKMTFAQSAITGTTISGCVDTSIEWDVSPSRAPFNNVLGLNYSGSSIGIPFRANKQNGFNLNVFELNINKPMDETPWASGYNVSLLYGPDAVRYNPSAKGGGGLGSDFAVKDANIVVRVPVGNGLDLKVGVFDSIIGYEVFEAGNNPNFTRSWGYAIEPKQHTGLLATYRINDSVAISAGVANTLMPGIQSLHPNTHNADNLDAQSYWEDKTGMASFTLTAPQSWGWMEGASFSAGAVYGFNKNSSGAYNVYVGLTVPTPIKGLAFGATFDYLRYGTDYLYIDKTSSDTYNGKVEREAYSFALYGAWQATEKLAFNVRGEYGHGYVGDRGIFASTPYNDHFSGDIWSLTTTLQYSLWANVISRVEARYDNAGNNNNFASNQTTDQFSVYLNLIYKF
ncbi:MAG TPA: outer membrane beta-barrel protein [Verrucomicrobiae bacterium]|jgi:hypothetical protein